MPAACFELSFLIPVSRHRILLEIFILSLQAQTIRLRFKLRWKFLEEANARNPQPRRIFLPQAEATLRSGNDPSDLQVCRFVGTFRTRASQIHGHKSDANGNEEADGSIHRCHPLLRSVLFIDFRSCLIFSRRYTDFYTLP